MTSSSRDFRTKSWGAEGTTALPDKEVVSILDLNADIDLAIDAAAPDRPRGRRQRQRRRADRCRRRRQHLVGGLDCAGAQRPGRDHQPGHRGRRHGHRRRRAARSTRATTSSTTARRSGAPTGDAAAASRAGHRDRRRPAPSTEPPVPSATPTGDRRRRPTAGPVGDTTGGLRRRRSAAPADGAAARPARPGRLSGNLLNVDVNLDADADIAAPINGAVAANANVAAPIDAAVAANVGCVAATPSPSRSRTRSSTRTSPAPPRRRRTRPPTSSSSAAMTMLHGPRRAHSPARRDAAPRRDVPVRADGIQLIGEMKGSGYQEPPALVRRGDGQTIQLTPLLYLVLGRDRRRPGRTTRSRRAVSAAVRQDGQRRQRRARWSTRSCGRSACSLKADGSEPELKKSNPLLAPAHSSTPSPTRSRRDRITAPFARAVPPGPSCWRSWPASSAVSWWVLLRARAWPRRRTRRFDKPGAAAARLRRHRPLRRLPRVRPRRRRPPRRLHPGRDGRGALPRLAGVLHRRHRLLPARPRRPASAPTSAGSTSTRSSRSASSASGGRPGTTRCCSWWRPRSCRWCAS